MSEMIHTRQSIGSQLREALDDMEAKGKITTESRSYLVANRTPGEMMDWLNARGYDIYFGKNPQDAATR